MLGTNSFAYSVLGFTKPASITTDTNSSAVTWIGSVITSILNWFYPVTSPIPTTQYVLPSGCMMPPDNNLLNSINKVKCGLDASDPLNNEPETQKQILANQYWRYDGTAVPEGAPYSIHRDTSGLHIGVQAKSSGQWGGFFAVTPNTNAQLFHAVISNPVRTIPLDYYENGLYVQTSHPFLNFVACVSITNNLGTIWAVEHTYGNSTQALEFKKLWVDNSARQSLTRDCTIITNGENYLKVYLDGAIVYSNSTLALGMPPPFNAYLEPETSYAGQMLNGTYTDFYAMSDENIKITNNPSNAVTAEIIDSSGKVLASAPVILGKATLSIGQYHLPVNANIKVYDSNNTQIASTPNTQTVYGGDEYYVNP